MLSDVEFDEWGYLPPGLHDATWPEIVALFGNSKVRERLITGLDKLLKDLKAAGVRDVYLDGSFVTEIPEPADYDLCWSPEGANRQGLPREFGYGAEAGGDPDVPNHELLKRKYLGDVWVHIPPYADFVTVLSSDRDGRLRGLVRVEMDSVE